VNSLRQKARLSAALAALLFVTLLPTPVAAQYLEDSIYVGCGTSYLEYNLRRKEVWGAYNAYPGRYFALICSTNQAYAGSQLPEPSCVACDSIDGKAYVSFYDSVAMLTKANQGVKKRIGLSSAGDLAWDPVSNCLFVACDEDDKVAVMDCHTDSIVGYITTDLEPFRLDLNMTGRRLFVTNDGSRTVSVIDVDSLRVIRTLPIPGGVRTSRYCYSGNKYYCSSDDGVYVLDGTTGERLTLVTGALHVWAMVPAEADGLVLAGYSVSTPPDSVYIISTLTDSIVGRRPLGGTSPFCMAWSPTTGLVYSANFDGVSVLSLHGLNPPKRFCVSGRPLVALSVPEYHRVYVGCMETEWLYCFRDTVSGVAEPPQRTPLLTSPATILGATYLHSGPAPAELVDAAGRKVVSIILGTNDLSSLPAGVYSVISPSSAPVRILKPR